jgi:hypothetical protein
VPPRWDKSDGAPSAGPPSEKARSRVLGFHSVAYGPTLRLGTGSLLGTQGQVASIHEQMHHMLTESTTYGQLMLASSVLSTAFPGHAWLDRNLRQLARRCRTVHEANATFTSTWLAADGDLALLAGSNEYQSWYRDGAEAIPLPDHSRLKMISLSAMATVCMCPPVLERFSMWDVLDEQDWRILPAEFPDRRFAAFHRIARDSIWSSILDQIRELLGSRAWDLFVPRLPDPEILDETFSEEYDAAVVAVSGVMQDRLAEEIRKAGYETQFATESTSSALIAHLQSYIPWVTEVMGTGNSRTPAVEELVANAYSERILLSDHPRRARIRDLRRDLLEKGLEKERSSRVVFHHNGNSPFLFLAVRTGRRILKQYAFDESQEDWLRDRLDEQFTYLLGTAADPDFEWDLFIAEDVDCLSELTDAVKGTVAIHLNRSLAATVDGLSPQALAANIMAADSRSVILDFPVLLSVKSWMTQGVPIRYAWGTLLHSGMEKLHFIVCRIPLSEEPVLIIGGALQARSLMRFLDEYGAEFDQTILSSENTLIPIIVHVIVVSEHVVDYRARFRGEFQ